jgi:hypothetical protein
LVQIVVLLPASVVLQLELISIHPEGIVDVAVVIERVQPHILQIVRQRLFFVEVQIIPRIVGVDRIHLSFPLVRLFVSLRLLYILTVEKIKRIDLVDRGQDKIESVLAVDQSSRQRVQEESFVDVTPGPDCRFVKRVEVASVVEQFEESDRLLQVVMVKNGEDFASGQQPLFVQRHELLNCRRVCVGVDVALDRVDFAVVFVGLVDVLEEVEDVALALQEYLVS